MKDNLGDRMKMYERSGEGFLFQTIPIIARLDGKAFHTFTRGLNKPFDLNFIKAMQGTTEYLVKETNACIGYTQSDEITLIYLTDTIKREVFMGGRPFKMISILSGMCANEFIIQCMENLPKHLLSRDCRKILFDCRVWNVPDETEACNILVWRETDAIRNSIQSLGQANFSPKELHGKSCDEIQEMLWSEKQINWNDFPSKCKRGAYFRRVVKETCFTEEEISKLPPNHQARRNHMLIVERHVVEKVDMPIFTKIINREDVVFRGSFPVTNYN